MSSDGESTPVSRTRRDAPHLYAAERMKAFVDAVVAIAMTLLILPLLESVSDVAGEDGRAI